ncbi:hypothetical protein BY996DRAFT_6412158 [Phakopsora pachyrhizi]|nr:hypothetical protein BY996DRAFT_6412158 [Phakopsora pachyrhizi]
MILPISDVVEVKSLVLKLSEKVQITDKEEDRNDESFQECGSQFPIMLQSTSSIFLAFKPKDPPPHNMSDYWNEASVNQTVVPSPLDWFEWVRVIGYWFLDEGITHDDKDGKNSKRCKGILKYGEKNTEGLVKQEKKKWEPKPELVQFLETANNAGKKIVYIGFCSIVAPNPEEMKRIIVKSIEKSDVYAVVSKGCSRCYYFNSVPHDWLFTKIHAACRHGGAGATGASLRVGIFTFIRPILAIDILGGKGGNIRDRCRIAKNECKIICQALINATADEVQIRKAKLDRGVRGRSFSENLVSESNSVQLVSDDIRSASTGVLPSSTKPIRARAIKTQKFVVLQNQPLATAPALNTTNYKATTKNINSDEDSSSWDILSHSKSEAAELSGSLKNLR